MILRRFSFLNPISILHVDPLASGLATSAQLGLITASDSVLPYLSSSYSGFLSLDLHGNSFLGGSIPSEAQKNVLRCLCSSLYFSLVWKYPIMLTLFLPALAVPNPNSKSDRRVNIDDLSRPSLCIYVRHAAGKFHVFARSRLSRFE